MDKPPYTTKSKVIISLAFAVLVMAGAQLFPHWCAIGSTPQRKPLNNAAPRKPASLSATASSPGAPIALSLENQITALRQRAEWLNQLPTLEGENRSEDAWKILNEWAALDPRGALEYAMLPLTEGNVRREFFDAADRVLSLWVKADVHDARDYVQSHIENTDAVSKLAPVLIDAHLSRSMEETTEWIDDHFTSDSGRLRSMLAEEIVQQVTGSEDGEVVDLVKWLSEPDVAKSAYAQPAVAALVTHLAEGDEAAALDFATRLPEGSFSRNLAWRETVRTITVRDPDRAFEWLSGFLRQETEIFVAPDVTETPTAPLLEGAISSQQFDAMLSGYAMGLANRSAIPEAMESLSSIVDPRLRNRSHQRILEIVHQQASDPQ